MKEGWKQVKLADYYKISSGLSKSADQFGSGFPFLSFKDVFWNYFAPNKLTQLVNTSEAEQKKCSVKKGDVFLTRTSEKVEELGMSCVALKDYPFATFNGFTKRLRPITQEIDPVFIGFYLRSIQFRAEITAYSTLTTRASLNNDIIGRLKINLPPLPTQRKIAAILSAYDDLIENNLKRIQLLEEKAQLTYEDWFELRKINGQIITDTHIKVGPISENIERFINGGWGKEETKGNYINEAYVIRGTDMPKVSLGQFDKLPLRFHTKSNLKSRVLQHGDIAIEMSNGNISNVGRSFYFDYSLSKILSKPTICASFCKMIRPKSVNLSYIIDAHLKYIYNNDKMLIYKAQAANGINNFNFDEMIKDEELYIPEGNHLNELSSSIKVNYDAISNIRVQNHLLKEARDILLPRLMTGVIDVEEM